MHGARLGDRLAKVPLADGSEPSIFPLTLGALIVGGSELSPGGEGVSGWNKEMSLRLITQYDAGYETDNENGTEENKAKSSRRRRLHLAKLIGVTPGQIQVGLVEAMLFTVNS